MSEDKKSLPERLKDPEFAKRFQDQAKQIVDNINPANPVDRVRGRSLSNEILDKHVENMQAEKAQKEENENRRDRRAFCISIIGIGISIVALGVSIIALFIQVKGE